MPRPSQVRSAQVSLSLVCLLLAAACGGSSPATPAAAAPRSTQPTTAASVAAIAPSADVPGSQVSAPAAVRGTVTPSSVVTRTHPPSPAAARATAPKPRPSPHRSPRRAPKPRPSPSRQPPAPAGATHALEMVAGNRFSPSTLTIAVGDSVRAHNGDTATHTFTGPSWDSGDIGPGGAKTLRFRTAGTFSFYCSPHQSLGMTGTLTVR